MLPSQHGAHQGICPAPGWRRCCPLQVHLLLCCCAGEPGVLQGLGQRSPVVPPRLSSRHTSSSHSGPAWPPPRSCPSQSQPPQAGRGRSALPGASARGLQDTPPLLASLPLNNSTVPGLSGRRSGCGGCRRAAAQSVPLPAAHQQKPQGRPGLERPHPCRGQHHRHSTAVQRRLSAQSNQQQRWHWGSHPLEVHTAITH